VSVSYSDLNLATEQGNLALYKRIVSAARQVCPTNTGPNARLAAEAQQCVDQAVARAVKDVQSAKLAELQATRVRRADRG
jgi:UrcA family protein